MVVNSEPDQTASYSYSPSDPAHTGCKDFFWHLWVLKELKSKIEAQAKCFNYYIKTMGIWIRPSQMIR